MLTGSPTARTPRVVTDSVCGISITLKVSGVTVTSVRLTPSIATEPLPTICRSKGAGVRKTMSIHSPERRIASTVATPSTCP